MAPMDKKRCGDVDDLLLPKDFLIQILVCLPVKSLLRFKSVCKSWFELIHSSSFIDLHTTTTTFNSSSSSSFGTFILQATEPSVSSYEDDIKLFTLSSSGSGDHIDGEDNDNEEEDDDDQKKKKMVFKLDEDLGFLPYYEDFLLSGTSRMVGSCNGIICLHDPEVMDISKGTSQQHYSHLRDVSLYNPATRQFRILPRSIPIQERNEEQWIPIEEEEEEEEEESIPIEEEQEIMTFKVLEDVVAFGYDVKTKDYKVLRITPFIPRDASAPMEEEGCMCRVQVYSLSTDSWRLLEGINSLPVVPTQGQFRNHGIYLNGSCFFLGTKRYTDGMCDDFMLLSFDFTKEIFTTMQLPDNYNIHKLDLSYLGDKIVVFTTPIRTGINDDCDGYEYHDIWVLNEQQGSDCGVAVNKESWTKLHSFRIKSRRPYSQPRCISNNGEFALISTISDDNRWINNKLQLFNLVTKEAKKDFLIGTGVCRADVYKESLVSIMGAGNNVLLRWQLPSHGTTYRLNLDAPFIDSYFPFGIGLCLTSDTGGGCIGVRGLKRLVRDEEEGEALAILEAIKWAKELKLSPIIIESDSKKCVSFFMDDDDDNNLTCWNWWTFSLLREAMLLLNSSELGISFMYCSRSCNYVADIAAKLGREGSWVCMDWSANFPGEIVRSLNRDLGKQISAYLKGYQN